MNIEDAWYLRVDEGLLGRIEAHPSHRKGLSHGTKKEETGPGMVKDAPKE